MHTPTCDADDGSTIELINETALRPNSATGWATKDVEIQEAEIINLFSSQDHGTPLEANCLVQNLKLII